jgi:ATP-binding cassette subfamily C protein
MNRAGGISALLDDYRAFAGARLWLALALMLLGAFAEGFGILMLVPLAAIAMGSSTPPGLTRLVDWLPADQRFLGVLALFLAAMGARSLLLYWRERELAWLQAGYEASLRLRAAATLARRGWAFAGNIGQAEMQALLLTDVPRAALAVAHAQSFATGLILLAVQLLLALLLSPALAAIALAILVLGYGVAARFTRRSVVSGIALTERSGQSSGTGFRLHAGLKAALAQGTAAQFLAEYRTSLARQQDETVRFAGDLASARQVAAFGAAGAAALILYAGVRLIHLPFAILIPSLVLFARTVAPAQMLQQSAQYIAAYSAAFDAVVRRLGRLEQPGSSAGEVQPLDWRELRLEEAGCRHSSGLGLSEVSLTLRRGEWIGIDGASGAGKTTLVDLIAGLLAPTSGAVLVDGREFDAAGLERWRAGLAYVGQEGSVFDDSIRSNLLADGVEAAEPDLWEALAAVGLADRVRALDSALDERVGDRGSRLSGGERQRLAIARALLRRPSLLILDEATAALDAGSESAVLAAIRALDPRPAAIIVAHRESTHAYCDSVVEIRHGVAEKSGDSSDLSG